MVENGGVKLFLGGEVAKDHSLRDARCLRNFLGGGAAKTSLGKETHGHRRIWSGALLPAIRAPGARHVNCNLIYLVKSYSLFAPNKVSTYLPL